MTELARSLLRPLSPSPVSSGLQSAAPWTPKASASPRNGINGPTTALADLPDGGVRASLLVRMWKEVESEAAIKLQESCINSPRLQCVDPAVNCPGKKVPANTQNETTSPLLPPLPSPPSEHENPSVIEIHNDEYNSTAESLETMGDQASDMGQCGGRVAHIVRKLSLVAQSEGGATPAAAASATPTAVAEHKRNEAAALLNEALPPATARLQDDNMQQRNESRMDEIKIERYAFNRNSPRVRGRMATMDVLVRMKHERQRELAALEENRAVSEFQHRSRIHAFLKFKCMRRGGTSRNQKGSPKLKGLRFETAVLPFRERSVASGCSSIPDSPTNSGPAYENRFAQTSDLAEPLSLAASSASFLTTTTMEEGARSVTEGGRGILLAKQSSFSDRGHSNEESEGNSDVLLEEDRSSVAENAEWDGCMGLETPERWQGGGSPEHQGIPASDVAQDEDEPLEGGRWMDFLSAGSHRPWESYKRSVRYEWYDSISDNPELEQLLKRKSVSTSLASAFRKKMDQLIMSHIEKREQLGECEYLDIKEESITPLQQKNNFAAQEDHAAPSSRSETPSVVEALGEQVEDNDNMLFADSSPQLSNSSELELIKGEITQLRHWMYKLQKSVENCMDMQVELQQSMRQVLSAVLCNSGRMEKVPTCYKQVSNNRGICCICCSVQVDSILYRCGHMCTCFNCASELQWSCRTCPICQANIDDVVRTYPNPC
ncbi:unnamed protein product [Victoria cruziana]